MMMMMMLLMLMWLMVMMAGDVGSCRRPGRIDDQGGVGRVRSADEVVI